MTGNTLIGEAPGLRHEAAQIRRQVSGQIPASIKTRPGSRSARCCHTSFISKSGPCCDAPTTRYTDVSASVGMLQIAVRKVTDRVPDPDLGSFWRQFRPDHGVKHRSKWEICTFGRELFPGRTAVFLGPIGASTKADRDGSAVPWVVRKFTSYWRCVLNDMPSNEPGRRSAPVFQLIASLPRWLGQGAPGKQIRSWEREL